MRVVYQRDIEPGKHYVQVMQLDTHKYEIWEKKADNFDTNTLGGEWYHGSYNVLKHAEDKARQVANDYTPEV